MTTKKVCRKTFRTKEAFLQNTIDYYSKNVKRRNMKVVGKDSANCKYNPFNTKNIKSQGCAIGRFMTHKNALKADKRGLTVDEILLKNKKLIPVWMRKFKNEFLFCIQMLHDRDENWDKKGLSKYGKGYIKYIIYAFDLIPKKIKF